VCLVFSALLLTSCATPKEFIHINPEPEKSAWFLRAQYSPNGNEIRGIPISKINSDWCAANELTKDEYLGKLSQYEKNGIENIDDVNFSVTGKFDSKTEMTALAGIYKTCSGDLGNFLLVIKERNDGNNEFVSLLNLSNQPAFTTLHKSNEDNKIKVWWCLNCDGISTLYWNKDTNGFDTTISNAELQEQSKDMQHIGSVIDANTYALKKLIGTKIPPLHDYIKGSAGGCVGKPPNNCSVIINVLLNSDAKPVGIYASRLIRDNPKDGEIADEDHWLITDVIPYPSINAGQDLDINEYCSHQDEPYYPVISVIKFIDSNILQSDWVYRLIIPSGKFELITPTDVKCFNE
jgi:hypothetical protein